MPLRPAHKLMCVVLFQTHLPKGSWINQFPCLIFRATQCIVEISEVVCQLLCEPLQLMFTHNTPLYVKLQRCLNKCSQNYNSNQSADCFLGLSLPTGKLQAGQRVGSDCLNYCSLHALPNFV